MPPVQENSRAAVATTFSGRVSEEITIVPSVERIWQRREAMNEKGLVHPVIPRVAWGRGWENLHCPGITLGSHRSWRPVVDTWARPLDSRREDEE